MRRKMTEEEFKVYEKKTMKLHGKRYTISWIPEHIREKIRDAVNNGMTEKELQLLLGNARVCKSIIDQEEDQKIREELIKTFPANVWFFYPLIKPAEILAKQRSLKGLAPELKKVKVPIEEFLRENEWTEEKNKFRIISTKAQQKIVKYFLDNNGRYVGIFRDWKYQSLSKRTQAKRKIKGYYLERIVIFGELPISLVLKRKTPILDKYSQKRRKQLLFTF